MHNFQTKLTSTDFVEEKINSICDCWIKKSRITAGKKSVPAIGSGYYVRKKGIQISFMEILITTVLFITFLLPKSILEFVYFKDKESALKTMQLFLAVLLAMLVATGFSVLLNYSSQ